MSALEARLKAQIARGGPISLAEYMTQALLDPEHGYYTTKPALGRAGDFITAPEISQIFGELIGLFIAQVWVDQGRPDPFHLVELGGGRGTLMADLLRATKSVAGFHDAMRLFMVEASPAMAGRQAQALAGYAPLFLTHLADLPEGPLFLVANEFFDALPIRQYQFTAGAWHERVIGLGAAGELAFGLGPAIAPDWVTPFFGPRDAGAIVERSLAGEALMGDIGARLDRAGGVALIIDYGADHSAGDTFQAIYQGAFSDPLRHAGQADLTAHVAFDPLARAAHPAKPSPIMPQGLFLDRLGAGARAAALAQRLSGDALAAHLAAYRRLTQPQEMGQLFKVMALSPEWAPAPPILCDEESA